MILNLIEQNVKEFIEKERPPIELRDQVDIGYSFDGSTIIIFEIRPSWTDSKEIIHMEIAKIRYYKSKKIWKLFWFRASGKWELYEPYPVASSLDVLLQAIADDKHNCFWG